MTPLLAFEVSVVALAVAVSVVFAVWRICGDVRKIREHLDRVAPEFIRDRQETASSPAPPGAPPQALKFFGTGDRGTFPADLEKALYSFKLTHAGLMDFAVSVMDPSGRRIELLVKTIGPFSGSKAVQIPAKGRYLLDVIADGDWSITAGAP